MLPAGTPHQPGGGALAHASKPRTTYRYILKYSQLTLPVVQFTGWVNQYYTALLKRVKACYCDKKKHVIFAFGYRYYFNTPRSTLLFCSLKSRCACPSLVFLFVRAVYARAAVGVWILHSPGHTPRGFGRRVVGLGLVRTAAFFLHRGKAEKLNRKLMEKSGGIGRHCWRSMYLIYVCAAESVLTVLVLSR